MVIIVLNGTFNIIYNLSLQSVLLMEWFTVLGENQRLQNKQRWNQTLTVVVIGTEFIGRCKSNYQTFTATTSFIFILPCVRNVYDSCVSPCFLHLFKRMCLLFSLIYTFTGDPLGFFLLWQLYFILCHVTIYSVLLSLARSIMYIVSYQNSPSYKVSIINSKNVYFCSGLICELTIMVWKNTLPYHKVLWIWKKVVNRIKFSTYQKFVTPWLPAINKFDYKINI